jgi:hypothetical protein
MLLFKLILVPFLIGALSLAGRRWGPAVGGWLAGLPWTSGPVALFLALEQGTTFASNAAQGTLMGLVAVAGFCMAYSVTAKRRGWLASLLAGWAAFLVITPALNRLTLPLGVAFGGTLMVLAAVTAVLPEGGAAETPRPSPWWEIPLRMVAALAMVLLITGAASSLGPRLSGLLSPFPIYATVLAAFTHQFEGAPAADRLLRGVMVGSFSFALFFAILAGTLPSWGLATSFGAAILGAIVTHGIGLFVLRSRLVAV